VLLPETRAPLDVGEEEGLHDRQYTGRSGDGRDAPFGPDDPKASFPSPPALKVGV
jgi:hypothetical protein